MKRIVTALIAVFLLAAPVSAARYTTTLTTNPTQVQAGDLFDVSGCGFNAEYGNVIVSFEGGGYGGGVITEGCFTIEDIPAFQGDTIDPGVYDVGAFQFVKEKLKQTGATTIEVVE